MASAEGIRAGRAYVELFADDSKLHKGLKAAEEKVKNFGKSVAGIGAALGGLGAAITAPLIEATRIFAESGTELLHMSERTGISVEALSALGYAAMQSGTDLEGVELAIRKMQKALIAGSLENQQAALTFARLGLSVQQLQKLRPEQQFSVIAKRIASIENPTAKAGAAMLIFGRAGTSLLPLIENMSRLTKEAQDFGLVTSKEAAEGAYKLEQSMNLLSAVAKKILATVGSALAPSFERWNIAMAKIGKTIKELIEKNKGLVVIISTVGFSMVAAGAAVVALGTAIWGLGQALAAVSAIIAVINGALLLLATPLGGLVLGFALMTTAMGKWGETGQAVAGFMKTNFAGVLKDVQDTIKGMSDALSTGDIRLAAQVLWAGLNLEWAKGIASINAQWIQISSSAVGFFDQLKTDIAKHLVIAFGGVESFFTKLKTDIANAWDLSTTGLKNKFLDFVDAIKDAWGDLMASLPEGLKRLANTNAKVQARITALLTGKAFNFKEFGKQLAAEQPLVGGPDQAAKDKADRAKAREERNKELANRVDGRAIAGAKEQVGIAQNAAGAQDVLQRDLDAKARARRKEEDPAIAAAKKQLADAQDAFNKLKKKAAAEAGEPEAFGEGGQGVKLGEGEPLTPEGLDKAMEKTKEKVDVSGGFQAQAVAGLGAGKSVQDEQLSEQKKTNDKLDKLNRKAAVGQLVFQP